MRKSFVGGLFAVFGLAITAFAMPGTEFSESDLWFDFVLNGGELPAGVDNPFVTYVGYEGNLPLPTKEGSTFAGWRIGDSDIVISNLNTLVFYKYEGYAYEVKYSDAFKWHLNALWVEDGYGPEDEDEPYQNPVATATTPEFRLSIKHDGIRTSAGEETLRYSSSWDGGSQQSARVQIAENGKTFSRNFGEGEVVWHASKVGTHVLTHTTYTNGIAGKVETATFVALNADPVPDVEAVQYIDFDGTVKSCTDWSPVSSSTLPAEWGFSGETTWYVADGDLTITNGTAQQGVDTVTVAGDVRLILKDGCDLKVLGWYGAAINVSGEGNSFTVYAQSDGNAMGKLTAEVVESSDSSSSKRGAGIGGGVLYTALQMSGNVTINGGHVCARGGMKCAGIGGGGLSYHATNIVINAGVVNASSPDEQWGAAGIGAGRLSPTAGHASDIQIHGGRVMASGSVGIGGSCGSRLSSDGGVRHVVISGGWISARGSHGAGIGGGSSSFGRSFDCDDILISGGHVEAYGGRGGAGIGGGGDALDDEGGNCNRIVITGGEVIAVGSESGGYAGAGIGGGGTEDARCDNVLITGGSVLAIGGNASASGVGGLSGTNVIISTVLTIKADGNNPPTTVIANGGGDLATALKGKQYFTAAKMLEDDDLPDEEVDDDTDDPDVVKDSDAVFSTYDYVGVYDGAVHTIDTNALVEAYAAAMGGEVTVVYAGDESGVRGAAALVYY